MLILLIPEKGRFNGEYAFDNSINLLGPSQTAERGNRLVCFKQLLEGQPCIKEPLGLPQHLNFVGFTFCI